MHPKAARQPIGGPPGALFCEEHVPRSRMGSAGFAGSHVASPRRPSAPCVNVPRMSPALRNHWILDPAVTFLNHGSFGACPRVVLDFASRLRERVEREPVRFFVPELERLADEALTAVAALVGASPGDLGFVSNATAA